MPRPRQLLVIGLATLAVALVAGVPARIVYAWFTPPAVTLSALGGTIWNGAAAEGRVGGVYLRGLEWRLRPWSLFAGRLAYRISAQTADGFLEGRVALGPGGTVTAEALRAALPIAALRPLLRSDDVQGDVTLQLERLELQDGWPTRLDGEAAVANLVVRAMAAVPLGDFRAEFRSGDDAIVGSVEDVAGMLDVAGSVRLEPDRSYSFTGRVGPTPQASPSVVQQLRFLGTPDARGLREFRFEGAL